MSELAAWSKLCRENFQVLLLCAMYSAILAVLLHVGHHDSDSKTVGFIEQVLTGVGGCLFGLLKGRESRPPFEGN